jgi:hypothetical protein
MSKHYSDSRTETQNKFHKALREEPNWIHEPLFYTFCEDMRIIAEEQLITTYNSFHDGYNSTRSGRGGYGSYLIGEKNYMFNIGKNHPLFGKPRSTETRARIKKNHVPRSGPNNTNSKTFQLISPTGENFQIFGNLKIFCADKGLPYSSVSKVLRIGTCLTSGPTKGWKIIRIEPYHKKKQT